MRARSMPEGVWKAIVNAVSLGGPGFMKNFTEGVMLEGLQ